MRCLDPTQVLPAVCVRFASYCTGLQVMVDRNGLAGILPKYLLFWGSNGNYATRFPNDHGHVSPRRGPVCTGKVTF
jgi:hypothetical protein